MEDLQDAIADARYVGAQRVGKVVPLAPLRLTEPNELNKPKTPQKAAGAAGSQLASSLPDPNSDSDSDSKKQKRGQEQIREDWAKKGALLVEKEPLGRHFFCKHAEKASSYWCIARDLETMQDLRETEHEESRVVPFKLQRASAILAEYSKYHTPAECPAVQAALDEVHHLATCEQDGQLKGFSLRELFADLRADLEKRIHEAMGSFCESDAFDAFLAYKAVETRRVSEADFTPFRILGRGGFGEVWAKKRTDTGSMYAVKVLLKGSLKRKRAEELSWNEFHALKAMRSPFVVGLKYAFQTPAALHLVIDLVSGGDLCYHLNKSPSGRFSQEVACFYAVEIMLGLRHLHERKYVYRDLKPDNVLLTADGHCKISDLGLSVKNDCDLVGSAGTMGYMAPEMFRRDRRGRFDPAGARSTYSYAVDWWSFGCLVFELMVGKCPFRTTAAKNFHKDLFGEHPKDGNATSYRYATCEMEVVYNSSVFQGADGMQAKKLIEGCLDRDARTRLGATDALFMDLKQHPWFEGQLSVPMVARQAVPAPFVPKSDRVNAESSANIRHGHQKILAHVTQKEQERWDEWSFASKNAFQTEVVALLNSEEAHGQTEFGNDGLDFCTIL